MDRLRARPIPRVPSPTPPPRKRQTRKKKQPAKVSAQAALGQAKAQRTIEMTGKELAKVAKEVFKGDCQRKARKDLIKFEVRDLLQLCRDPPKIKIEARIDSNACARTKSVRSGKIKFELHSTATTTIKEQPLPPIGIFVKSEPIQNPSVAEEQQLD